MIDKKRYTVDNPPRMHEVAKAAGMSSEQTRSFIYLYNSEIYRTPSHRVPLRVALGFLTWLKLG
jgi:hypothetical protein